MNNENKNENCMWEAAILEHKLRMEFDEKYQMEAVKPIYNSIMKYIKKHIKK